MDFSVELFLPSFHRSPKLRARGVDGDGSA